MDGAHAGKKGDTGTGEGAVEEAVGEHAVVGGGGVSCVVRFAVSQLKSPMLQIRVRRSPDVQWTHTCKNSGPVDLSEGRFFFK